MCKSCDFLIDLIDILLNSDTSDEDSNNPSDPEHSHRLFDSADKNELEKLKKRMLE